MDELQEINLQAFPKLSEETGMGLGIWLDELKVDCVGGVSTAAGVVKTDVRAVGAL